LHFSVKNLVPSGRNAMSHGFSSSDSTVAAVSCGVPATAGAAATPAARATAAPAAARGAAARPDQRKVAAMYPARATISVPVRSRTAWIMSGEFGQKRVPSR
jgi:hypothetical protein